MFKLGVMVLWGFCGGFLYAQENLPSPQALPGPEENNAQEVVAEENAPATSAGDSEPSNDGAEATPELNAQDSSSPRDDNVEETVTEEVTIEEAPLAEAPLAEAPLAEAPLAEAPLAEAPLEEAPLEEAPLAEAPLEQFINSQGETFDLSTFTNYNVYFLENITIKDLSSSAEEQQQEEERVSVSDGQIRNLVMTLVEANNEIIIRKLARELDEAYAAEEDLEFLKNEVLNAINPQPEGVATKPQLTRVPLLSSTPLEGILLDSADIVDIYDRTVGEKTERMIELNGGVKIFIDRVAIGGDFIRINLTRNEAFVEGKILIRSGEDAFSGEKAFWDIDAGQGFVFNATGELGIQYIEGALIRLNSSEHISMESGWVTYSNNPDPYYRIKVDRFDAYDNKRWIVQNAVVNVGDHPFFWLPYYINYPLGTGLILSFGETRREGLYALSQYTFEIPLIGNVHARFNVYEKLGLYASLENANSLNFLSYDILFITALYTYNENTSTIPSLRYTYHTGEYLESRYKFRYKLAYNQRIDLITEENTSIQSSIDFSLTNVSDPLITSNFPLDLSHADWQHILERSDRLEDLYNPSASDKDAYAIKYTLTAPTVSIGANFNWNYSIYDDPALRNDDQLDERYTIYLKALTLPSFTITHQTTFDQLNKDDERSFFLNIPYKVDFSYKGTTNYKDGQDLNEGQGTDQSVLPYELINDEYNLTMGLSASRPFSINAGSDSIFEFANIDWFSWQLAPNFSFRYEHKWKGIDYSSSDNKDDDRAETKLSYGFSTGLNLLTNNLSVLDQKFSFSFNISKLNRVFSLPAGETFPGTLLSRREENVVNYTLSTSAVFDFPSGNLVSIWQDAIDYRSMLPYFVWSVFYQQAKFTSQEFLDENNDFAFDRYNARTLGSSLDLRQQGYGLFYLPQLDYNFNHNLEFSYNLLPDEDENGEYVTENNSIDFWRIDRINSLSGSLSFDLKFNYFSENLIQLRNNLNYHIYNPNEKTLSPEFIVYKMNASMGYNNENKPQSFIGLKSFNIGFVWNYYFRERDYRSDSMSFNLSFMLDLFKRYQIQFELRSLNNQAYRYFAYKANALGREPVNFFNDLVNSSGVTGISSQLSSLFKLSGFSFSFYHDIGDWFASFTYTFSPVAYEDDSLRGFYIDHRFEFEINLKPARDPRGPAVGSSDPFFEKIEEEFTTDVFDRVRRLQ